MFEILEEVLLQDKRRHLLTRRLRASIRERLQRGPDLRVHANELVNFVNFGDATLIVPSLNDSTWTTTRLERFRLVHSTVAVVLLCANGGGDGAVFDGSAEARRAGMGCERGRRGDCRDVRREPSVGASLDPTPARDGLPRATPANEVSIARVGGAGAAAVRTDHGEARYHAGGIA